MTTSAPINETDRKMLASATSAALALLPNIRGNSSSDAIIDAVHEYLNRLFARAESNPLGEDAPMAFGALFGSTICEAFGWNWIIASHGDWEGLGVVDDERRYLILPLAFMDELFSANGAYDRSPKLIFNCIKDSNFPESSPRQFVLLT